MSGLFKFNSSSMINKSCVCHHDLNAKKLTNFSCYGFCFHLPNKEKLGFSDLWNDWKSYVAFKFWQSLVWPLQLHVTSFCVSDQHSFQQPFKHRRLGLDDEKTARHGSVWSEATILILLKHLSGANLMTKRKKNIFMETLEWCEYDDKKKHTITS